MTDKYRLIRLFRDDQTRIVIPNLDITATAALTNIVSSYVTNPTKGSDGYFSNFNNRLGRRDNPFTNDGIFEGNNVVTRTLAAGANGITSIVKNIIDLLIIGFGVTKLETSQEYTMPFSKGIGSTGEVIHLLGAKNELIHIEFKTDQYPGRLGYILRAVLQKVLEDAQVIYLLDDLFLATPCLIRKTKIYKEGVYRGAVMGELELVSLTTGGSFIEDTLGGKDKVKGFAKYLKDSIDISIPLGVQIGAVIGVGAITVLGGLIPSIVGGI